MRNTEAQLSKERNENCSASFTRDSCLKLIRTTEQESGTHDSLNLNKQITNDLNPRTYSTIEDHLQMVIPSDECFLPRAQISEEPLHFEETSGNKHERAPNLKSEKEMKVGPISPLQPHFMPIDGTFEGSLEESASRIGTCCTRETGRSLSSSLAISRCTDGGFRVTSYPVIRGRFKSKDTKIKLIDVADFNRFVKSCPKIEEPLEFPEILIQYLDSYPDV